MKFLKGWECKLINDVPINSATGYNILLTSEHFWGQFVKYDRVLIFQHDSRLLRDGIEEFLEYDYVGAPWLTSASWAHPERKGGNGGLSLRCPKKAVNLVRELPYSGKYGNEDVYYSNYLEKIGGNVAPYNVCAKFSCETEFKLGTLGYHAIEKHLTTDQVNKIKTQYQ